jgi:hypothetical protein
MRRNRIGAFITAGIIAVGALMTVNAPAAQAKPIAEKTIRSECKADGGTYGTYVYAGHRYSSCGYRDIDGNYWMDNYTDGHYTHTV